MAVAFFLIYVGWMIICFIMAVVAGAYAVVLAVMFLAALIKVGIVLGKHAIRAIRDHRSRAP